MRYVAAGMMGQAVEGIALRSNIGPGFLVCLYPVGTKFGAFINVGPESIAQDGGAAVLRQRLGELQRSLAREGASLRGASAELVGGADVLELYPRAQRESIVDAQVKELCALLEEFGIHATAFHVGGTGTRTVALSAGETQATIVLLERQKTAQITPPSQGRILVGRSGSKGNERLVNAGDLEVASAPDSLGALLGSCVGVALFDRKAGIGGMAHVQLPYHAPTKQGLNGHTGRYANTAIPALVEKMERRGAIRKHMVAKLVGGAAVLQFSEHALWQTVGRSNVERCRETLREAAIPIVAEDVGGKRGRRVSVCLTDFEISVQVLDSRKENR